MTRTSSSSCYRNYSPDRNFFVRLKGNDFFPVIRTKIAFCPVNKESG